MLARSSVPGLGAQCSPGSSVSGDGYLGAGQWQISVGYRWQRSDTHFVGKEEQKQREILKTAIVNDIHLFDFAATYAVTQRFNLTISMPFLVAKRTRPGELDRLNGIPDAPDQISRSTAIGDMAVSGRFWLFRPPAENRQNVSFGIGLKLPTGSIDTKSTVDTPTGRRTRINDQSIQPGDGGVGLVIDTQAFKGLGRTTLYFNGSYLINPRNTNGVETGRSRPSEAIMSVSDQYLARAGVILPFPGVSRLAVTMGGRIEGVPVKDLVGKSGGFRRPGYAISADPGLIYFRGRDIWSVNVPIAVSRNRQKSVTDMIDGRHGDAAFADYFITVGYSRRF